MKNGKTKSYLVHHLIGMTFLNKGKGKVEVNHKNGNGFDNRVENLEWATRSENILHAMSTGLNKLRKPVIQLTLDDIEIARYISIKEAGQKTGINAKCICNVCKGKQITSGNFKWKYA